MGFTITERKSNGMIRYQRKCTCGWSESSTNEVRPNHNVSYTCPKCRKHNSGVVR